MLNHILIDGREIKKIHTDLTRYRSEHSCGVSNSKNMLLKSAECNLKFKKRKKLKK